MLRSQIAVVVPAAGVAVEEKTACAQIWSQTAEVLKPALGTLYSRFYPATKAWGCDIRRPFGVIFGKTAPKEFLTLFHSARKAQSESIVFHLKGMISPENLEQAQKCGDMLICQIEISAADKKKASHALWYFFLQKGMPFPDCGIYYVGNRRAVASPKEENCILANLGNYALCVVTVEKEEDWDE